MHRGGPRPSLSTRSQPRTLKVKQLAPALCLAGSLAPLSLGQFIPPSCLSLGHGCHGLSLHFKPSLSRAYACCFLKPLPTVFSPSWWVSRSRGKTQSKISSVETSSSVAAEQCSSRKWPPSLPPPCLGLPKHPLFWSSPKKQACGGLLGPLLLQPFPCLSLSVGVCEPHRPQSFNI